MNLAVLPALIDWQPRTRLIFGPGVVARAGALASELGLHDVLLVCDEGIVRAGYAEADSWAALFVAWAHTVGKRPVTWALPREPYTDIHKQVVAGKWGDGLDVQEVLG